MSPQYSPDEVQQRYIAAMGPKLGPVFHRFFNECAWLHLKWREYVTLFGTSQSRLDLLNSTARGFFGVVERTLRMDILLHICRVERRHRGRP